MAAIEHMTDVGQKILNTLLKWKYGSHTQIWNIIYVMVQVTLLFSTKFELLIFLW